MADSHADGGDVFVVGLRTFCLRSVPQTAPASLRSTPSSWESAWTKYNYFFR